jgi:hypothetical protein
MRQTPADAVADVAYQETVLASGAVCLPRPVRTVAGEVLVDLGTHQVRAYQWVDLLPTDPRLDPAVAGATIAAIHQVAHTLARPLIGRYTEAVGASRWAELLNEAMAVNAPFADALDAEITELRHLEDLIEPPVELAAVIVTCGPTTSCRLRRVGSA